MDAENQRPEFENECHHCKDTPHRHRLGFESCPVPDAPFYVVGVDTFLSSTRDPADWLPTWGRKTNRVFVPVPDKMTAFRVLAYVKARGDVEGARITTEKPKASSTVFLSNLCAWLKNSMARRGVDWCDRDAIRLARQASDDETARAIDRDAWAPTLKKGGV